jgi:hypothetical protein
MTHIIQEPMETICNITIFYNSKIVNWVSWFIYFMCFK